MNKIQFTIIILSLIISITFNFVIYKEIATEKYNDLQEINTLINQDTLPPLPKHLIILKDK